MRATEIIQELMDLIDKHGDLEVVVSDESDATIEFNDDDADTQDPVFVIS